MIPQVFGALAPLVEIFGRGFFQTFSVAFQPSLVYAFQADEQAPPTFGRQVQFIYKCVGFFQFFENGFLRTIFFGNLFPDLVAFFPQHLIDLVKHRRL